MATTSFSESLKYGGRLFGFFLAIVLVGGGLFGLGGYLAVPEIQAIVGSGTVETAPIAGGLVLAALGLATLVIGNFALVYKLLADSVSRGVEDAPAIVEMDTASEAAAEPSEERTGELGPSPGEQTARQHGPGQAVPSGEQSATPQADQPAQEETAEGPREQPASSAQSQSDESPPEEQAVQHTDGQQSGEQPRAEESVPDQQSPETTTAQPADRPEQSTADQPQGTGEVPAASEPSAAGEGESREQTAEEIVFGTANQSEAEEQESDPEPSPDDAEIPEDEEQSTAEETNREDIETAGNSSADPLGDRFEEK